MKKATKIGVIILATLTAFAFTSCQKDGVYSPKEKISKIYQKEDGGDKYLSEQWVWDGKKLTTINFVDDNYTVNFVYDGKQLSEMNMGDQKVVFTYDGKYIQKADIYDGSEIAATYTYTHDGKLITSVKVESFSNYKNAQRINKILNRIITPEIADIQGTQIENNDAKSNYSYTEYFTYDGNNISEIITKYSNGAESTYNYTYSDYLNPFYRLLFRESDSYNKNLVSTYHYSDNQITTRVIDLTVTVSETNGKYPAHATYTQATTHHVGNLDNTYTSVTEYFYEYE